MADDEESTPMNWINNYVRPRLRALVAPKEVPDNLWIKCPSCGQMLYKRDLEANLNVCHHCNHHMRLGPKQRLAMLFDEGRFAQIELLKAPPLLVSRALSTPHLRRYSCCVYCALRYAQ